MDSKLMTVSQVVKVVGVESHVLRFWEEQLGLSIARSELGHRVYTQEDVDTFLAVKEWKKQGLHLKEMVPLVAKLRGSAGQVPVLNKNVQAENLEDRCENVVGANTDSLHRNNEHAKAKQRVEPQNEKLQQFQKIMKRVIRESIAESKSPEGRYKKVDATIRHHQRFRKLVAVARDEK